jgi:hypothetical protein
MNEGSNKIPIIWLNGGCSYIAIISKECVKENFGPDEINEVILEIKDSTLLIKNKQKKAKSIPKIFDINL